MRKLQLFLLVGAAVVTLLSSCSKYPGFKKAESGFYYKFYEQNEDSLKADTNFILTMKIRYRVPIGGKDSVFFDSKDMQKPFQIGIQKPQFKGDVFEAFAMLHQGDSATFILNAKDFFTKTAQYPTVPPGVDSTSMIYFDVKVLKVESLEQMKKDAEAKAEKLKGEESGKMQAYLTSKGITATPSASGVYYVEEKAGSGRAVQTGDMIKMDFTVATVDGNQIFSTLDRKQPITFEYGKPFDTKGFDEGISKMKKGGKAKFIVPSVMGFGDRGRKDMGGNEIIPPYSTIVYEVEILDIQTKAQHDKEVADKAAKDKADAKTAEVKEPSVIQKYIKDKGITVKPTASGLYYVEKVKGKGAKAIVGKKVSVHYTGHLVDGTVFDSSLERKPSQPYEFTLGKGEVIPGWDEGIALMNEGGKATLVVPSKLGYGENGNGNIIKPFFPLVFEVELVKVSK
ncbi:MAG: FKBP-type peptidyl-prolyl cis-trans isomerase [Bacteroidales bacterium]|nr:FKBP-type peptidyl-prolyl cis-trans isomerase [Bacteroidales bacterium]